MLKSVYQYISNRMSCIVKPVSVNIIILGGKQVLFLIHYQYILPWIPIAHSSKQNFSCEISAIYNTLTMKLQGELFMAQTYFHGKYNRNLRYLINFDKLNICCGRVSRTNYIVLILSRQT